MTCRGCANIGTELCDKCSRNFTDNFCRRIKVTKEDYELAKLFRIVADAGSDTIFFCRKDTNKFMTGVVNCLSWNSTQHNMDEDTHLLPCTFLRDLKPGERISVSQVIKLYEDGAL